MKKRSHFIAIFLKFLVKMFHLFIQSMFETFLNEEWFQLYLENYLGLTLRNNQKRKVKAMICKSFVTNSTRK